jgi:hypothetical protein
MFYLIRLLIRKLRRTASLAGAPVAVPGGTVLRSPPKVRPS